MAPLGNLVRLLPLQLQEIPFHTDLETPRKHGLEETNQDIATTESPENLLEHDGRSQIVPFVKEVLNEAIRFINDTVPSTFKEGNVTPSKPSAAEVRLLSRNISKSELIEIPWSTSRIVRQSPVEILRAGEAWFARRSHHENCRKEGTVDFAQLDWGLRVNHSEHEQEYTPDVFDSYKVLDWDMETEVDELSVDGYSHISMKGTHNSLQN